MRGHIAIAIASIALVACGTAALSSTAAVAATTAATTTAVTDAQKTQRVFDDTNEVRAEAGTTPLVRNASLDKVAQDWAYQQWKNGAMSHNPDYSKQIPAGWSHAGENVASGYTYDTVVAAWKNSPEHYKNLVGDYTDIGIGYYEGADGKRYWVQEFAKYSTTKVPAKQTPTAPASPSSSPSSTASTPASTPSSTASSAPATSAPTTSGGAAEPAAPAGTALALRSPSFEGSSTGWTASGATLDGPNANAKGGKYALAVSGGQTVSQTVTTTVTAGETDTATVWVKPGSTSGITGQLILTTVGGSAETATSSFSDSSGWMKVAVSLPVTKSGHTGLVLEVVLSNSGRSYRLDSASLVRTKNAPAATASAAPAPAPSSTPAKTTTTTSPAKTTAAAPATTPAPAPSASSTPAPTTTSAPKSGLDLGVVTLELGG